MMGHTLHVVSTEACFEDMELGPLPLCPADSELLVASSSMMIPYLTYLTPESCPASNWNPEESTSGLVFLLP